MTKFSLRIVIKDEENDQNHEKIVLLNNDIEKHIIFFYRNIERVVSMSHFWNSFISETQLLRNQIDYEILKSFLIEKEFNAIKFKHNAHIFPEFINSKSYFRFKDNLAAAIKISRIDDVFTKSIANVEKHTEFKTKIKVFRAKVNVFEKQTNVYDIATKFVEEKSNITIDEINLENLKMIYLEKEISFFRKELNTHFNVHENHLICVAKKFRDEMSTVATYVNRAKKRFRDDIQLKIATDFKLLKDIKNNEQFELKNWQIVVLFSNAHECQCFHCIISLKNAFQFAIYKFENTLSKVFFDENDIIALFTRSTKRFKFFTFTSSFLKIVMSIFDKNENIVKSDNDIFIFINKTNIIVIIVQNFTIDKNEKRVVQFNVQKFSVNNEMFDFLKNKQIIAIIVLKFDVDKNESRVVQFNAQKFSISNETFDSMKNKHVIAIIAQKFDVDKDENRVVKFSDQEFVADSERDDIMKKDKIIANIESDFDYFKSAFENVIFKISNERFYRFDDFLIDDVLRRRFHSSWDFHILSQMISLSTINMRMINSLFFLNQRSCWFFLFYRNRCFFFDFWIFLKYLS